MVEHPDHSDTFLDEVNRSECNWVSHNPDRRGSSGFGARAVGASEFGTPALRCTQSSKVRDMAQDLVWDPYTAAHQISPYAIWKRMRDEAPCYRSEKYGFFAVSRFDDVLQTSLDTETFSSAKGITLDAIPMTAPMPMMIMMDPPLHDVLRKVVNRVYTPRRVNALESRITELCAEYLDPFVGVGAFDYMEEFAARLPVMVISSLLGFPEEDHDQLREWSDMMLHREEGEERMSAAVLEMMT